MIADAVEVIRRELREHLVVRDDEVIVDSARTLFGKNNPRGAGISVVNLAEEPALQNTPHAEPGPGPLRHGEAPVQLTLYLLFAFDFRAYAASLTYLARTVDLFRARPVFAAATQTDPGDVPFPATLEKLVFEMVNMNLEELSNLWGMLGAAYRPSVVYKVRLVQAQPNVTA